MARVRPPFGQTGTGRASSASLTAPDASSVRDWRQLVRQPQEERWRLASGIPVRAKGLSLSDYSQEWLEVMRCRLRVFKAGL